MTERVIILQDGDPALRQRSAEVTDFGPELASLVHIMVETVISRGALGLAAIQIGIAQRVVVVRVDGKWWAMVNPVITRTLNRYAWGLEGCLSVPKSRWREVSRPAKCDITWQDLNGQQHSATFSGMLARALQHEIDHLDGVLITDNIAVRSAPR